MQRIKLLSVIIVIAAALVIALYLVFSSNIFQSSTPDLNTSYVSVYNPNCVYCSNGVPSRLYSLLEENGYSSTTASLDYGSVLGNAFIENNDITTLPSAVLPATTATSSALLSSLLYTNIFNSVGNNYVLNTPFVAALTRNVTYFNIIQNRTITAFDVYNLSRVYDLAPGSTLSRVINPMIVLMQFNNTNITSGNKTDIIFVYSDSPFSAMQSLILENALSNFGTFKSSIVSISKETAASAAVVFGPQPAYNLSDMAFSSRFFNLESYNASTLANSVAYRELFEYDQNSGSELNSILGNFMPFLDIGGSFISVSSMLTPDIFNGFNITQVYNELKTNSSVGQVFNDGVSFIDAMLCSYTGLTESICNTTAVKTQAKNIIAQI